MTKMKSLRRAGLATGLVAGLAALALFAVSTAAVAAEKVLRWGKGQEITSFDVHIAGTVASWEMFQRVYETLVTSNGNLEIEPGLASSWEQTSPTTYVFHLRKNAKWSNGRPVDADDVVGSLDRIRDPETASYWAKQLGDIKEVVAVDSSTVRVELERPHTAFLPALAHITAAIIPIKEMNDGSYDPTKQLLGSGPFRVVEHKQDESWRLERNPYYWRPGQPVIDRLDILIIPDEAARLAALRDGRIDFATFSNPDIPLLASKERNIEVKTQQTTNYFRVDVNALGDSPFKDKRVRQAMNLALDRQAIADIAFAGTTVVDYPVPQVFGKAACRDTPTYAWPREKRLERARALLKEAGLDKVKVGLIATPANALFPRIAQIMQQNLAEVGFDVEIQQLPFAEYLSKVFTEGDFDFSISWLAGYTDPSMIISWWNPEFAVWNRTFMESVPALNEALAKVKQMPAGPERDAQLIDICRMIDDGANLLALVSKVDYVAYRADRVKLTIDPKSGSSDTYQHLGTFQPLY